MTWVTREAWNSIRAGADCSDMRNLLPPPALCGFLLLLVLIFAASYAVGAAVDPVAPGMHDTDRAPGGGGDTDGTHGDGH